MRIHTSFISFLFFYTFSPLSGMDLQKMYWNDHIKPPCMELNEYSTARCYSSNNSYDTMMHYLINLTPKEVSYPNTTINNFFAEDRNFIGKKDKSSQECVNLFNAFFSSPQLHTFTPSSIALAELCIYAKLMGHTAGKKMRAYAQDIYLTFKRYNKNHEDKKIPKVLIHMIISQTLKDHPFIVDITSALQQMSYTKSPQKSLGGSLHVINTYPQAVDKQPVEKIAPIFSPDEWNYNSVPLLQKITNGLIPFAKITDTQTSSKL